MERQYLLLVARSGAMEWIAEFATLAEAQDELRNRARENTDDETFFWIVETVGRAQPNWDEKQNAESFPAVTLSKEGKELPRTPFNIAAAMAQLRDEYVDLMGEEDFNAKVRPTMEA